MGANSQKKGPYSGLVPVQLVVLHPFAVTVTGSPINPFTETRSTTVPLTPGWVVLLVTRPTQRSSGVAVEVGVAVAVGVGVGVEVGVGVLVGVAVAVGDRVGCGVPVAVEVAVGAPVGVPVGVAVAVGVGVGTERRANLTTATPGPRIETCTLTPRS